MDPYLVRAQPPSPPKAEIYDTDRFAQLLFASRSPLVTSMALAANYMTTLISQNGYHCAIMGGWAVYIRGGSRSTNDVDVCVRCTMPELVTILWEELRICIPQQYGHYAITLFVHTGGEFDASYPSKTVEVDIIIGGQLNTPSNMPEGTEDVAPADVTLGGKPIRVISVPYHFAGKLSAFHGRRSRHDFIDLDFLFSKYSQELVPYRDTFDPEHRKFFLDMYANTNPQAEDYIAYMKQVLGVV